MSPVNLNPGREIDPRHATKRAETDRTAELNASPQTINASAPQNIDSIRVSERASTLGELTAKAEQLPEIRQERIDQLRTQIQSGEYRPSSEEIADAILKDEGASTGA
jgi:negative regulator of flagellin synthesis FlgM